MKSFRFIIPLLLVLAFLTSGCALEHQAAASKRLKVGIMLSDDGLGDQSYNDSAFSGLMKARDELNIEFDYRELAASRTYYQGLSELVNENCDVVIGIGFAVKESLEKIAKKYPKQQFLLIDSVSDAPNVAGITFKTDEGSFLAGAVAALKTQTNIIGFIGGKDIPLIQAFEQGFLSGVKTINPDIKVLVQYADSFQDADLGAQIAAQMDDSGADIIFGAAGYTGVGLLLEQQKRGKLAIGVDNDQFFVAEKSVLTSMIKNMDVAIYTALESYMGAKAFLSKQMIFGLEENAVGLAPIRLRYLTSKEEETIETLKQKLLTGEISIPKVLSQANK